MIAKYFALLTNLGAAKLANAAALGTQLQITQMAVGDGGGTLPTTPNPAQTQLIDEKRRAVLNALSIDEANSSQIIAEQVIPETDGGWWIREVGLFDKDGILIAIANCPETYKPKLPEGSGRTQILRMILAVSSTAAVTLKTDPSVVLATRQHLDEAVKAVSNGRFIGQKIFTTLGTFSWQPSVGTKCIKITLTGGGGVGSGQQKFPNPMVTRGAGGGAGGTAIAWRPVEDTQSYALVVGRGATATEGATSSTFAGLIPAENGDSAFRDNGKGNCHAGGYGGTAVGGDINLTGGWGSDSPRTGDGTSIGGSGDGGASFWGGGSRSGAGPFVRRQVWKAAPGSGGGGSSDVDPNIGAHGMDGIIVMEEYS